MRDTRFNEDRPADKRATSQWIGKKLKSLSLRHRLVKGYAAIILTKREYWTLLDQYGCGRDSENVKELSTKTLPNNNALYQHVTAEVESSRVSQYPWDEPFEAPPEEVQMELEDIEFQERVAIMMTDGGLSREEAERRAREKEW